MISCDLTGNYGNHQLFYTFTRTIAETLGYEWGFNKIPSHDYYNGKLQMDFFDLDYGKEHDAPFGVLPDGITNEWCEKFETFYHVDRVDFHPYDESIWQIKDNTKLILRCVQDARYYQHKKDDIRNWFKIKEEKIVEYQRQLKQLNLELDENTCIVNVRGGWEYLNLTTVLLGKDYWTNSINYMKTVNPNMRFICVTDNVNYGKQLFDFPVIHLSIGGDYYLINSTHYLILSNSSFPILGSWLNQNAKKIISPKYWARFNCSNGYWASSQMDTFGFNFLDREGRLHESI